MRSPPQVQKLSAAKQRRLDELLNKNSEGTITEHERRTLEKLVGEAEQLMVKKSQRLARFSEKSRPERSAVPVTIWLQPQSVER